MRVPHHWHRRLVIAGLTAMLLGAVDPLEGSVVIAAGTLPVVLGTPRGRGGAGGSRVSGRVRLACGLVSVGVAALWIMSAFGGVGGATGRSMWWLLLVAPYPVGWLLGIIGAAQRLRECARGQAHVEPPLG